jgi:hypothetical protein
VGFALLPLLFKERAGVRFAALSVVLNHSSSQPSPLRGEGANPNPKAKQNQKRNPKPTETARYKCLKTAVKNDAERTVRDLWLEA